jgi:ubiquinone/menaquinone biosynthesis C-methylase UbiE
VLHEVEDKLAFLQEVARVLRPQGILAVIEWKKTGRGEYGPAEQMRIAEDDLKIALQACTFANLQVIEINQDMYAVVATI